MVNNFWYYIKITNGKSIELLPRLISHPPAAASDAHELTFSVGRGLAGAAGQAPITRRAWWASIVAEFLQSFF